MANAQALKQEYVKMKKRVDENVRAVMKEKIRALDKKVLRFHRKLNFSVALHTRASLLNFYRLEMRFAHHIVKFS
jgi:hypothetical protein